MNEDTTPQQEKPGDTSENTRAFIERFLDDPRYTEISPDHKSRLRAYITAGFPGAWNSDQTHNVFSLNPKTIFLAMSDKGKDGSGAFYYPGDYPPSSGLDPMGRSIPTPVSPTSLPPPKASDSKVISEEFPFDSELVTDRVNLKNTINALLTSTYIFKPSTEQLKDLLGNPRPDFTNSDEAKQLYRDLKEERNAITAILLHDIWFDENFKLERSKIPERGGGNPSLRASTAYYFDAALKRWLVAMEQNNTEIDSLRAQLYDRLKDNMRLNDFAGVLRPHTDVEEFLSNGISTASTAAWGLARVIPRLARKQSLSLSDEELLAVMDRAFRKIGAMLASLHQDIAARLIRRLAAKSGESPPIGNPDLEFDPKFFELKPDDDGKYALFLKSNMLKEERFAGVPIFGGKPKTKMTWCPARYSVDGDQDVITGYFAWITEMARTRYLPSLRS